MAWVRALPVLLALALVASCRSEESGPITGSETHFLSWCSSDGSCDGGFECVCGVCTAACSLSSQCEELGASAECLALGEKPADQTCSDAPAGATCEVACDGDADCFALPGEPRCDRGFCRRLASDCAAGELGDGDVVVLGDSFFADSGAITGELERLARERGALGTNAQYRDYSSSLITPFGGGADLADQYASARDEGSVRVAIVTIGGPDILLSSCPEPVDATCAGLQNAVSGAEALLQQMADDGVESVIDVSHPDPVDASFNARLAALRPLLQSVCAGSPVRCHFVDLAPTFEGHAEYLLPDGLNPTSEGAGVAAAVIWSAMQRHCVAQ